MLVALWFLTGCTNNDSRFATAAAPQTAITYSNLLTVTERQSPAGYHTFYDGGGAAVGDINNDGLPDLFFCSNHDEEKLYLNKGNLTFEDITFKTGIQPNGSRSSGAVFADFNGDGFVDLYICNAGNQCVPGGDLFDRLYMNDGNNNFNKSSQMLPSASGLMENHSCVIAADFDADGDIDLFVGASAEANQYGYPLRGYLLQNDGNGVFTDVTETAAPSFKYAGMVSDAAWLDYDKDGRPDLVIAGENMPVKIFHNNGGKLFEEKTPGFDATNWCNRVVVTDVNDDGYPDIIMGCNRQLPAFNTPRKVPVNVLAGDFNNSGVVQQVVYIANCNKPCAGCQLPTLTDVLPGLKGKILRPHNYAVNAKADFAEDPGMEVPVNLDGFTLLNGVLLNDKKRGFIFKPAPLDEKIFTRLRQCSKDFE